MYLNLNDIRRFSAISPKSPYWSSHKPSTSPRSSSEIAVFVVKDSLSYIGRHTDPEIAVVVVKNRRIVRPGFVAVFVVTQTLEIRA